MPQRSEIWLFEPDPAVGHERTGIRPGVIVSSDALNLGPRELLVVVPITTRQRPSEDYPYHVRLMPELTGLDQVSYAMCEQVRSVSSQRVYGRRSRGRVVGAAMREIEDSLRIVLEL